MAHLTAATPILRRRAFYQSCLFFAFSLFWTTVPLLLAGPHYRMTQNGIALFGLAGVSGAIAAPIAGRLADRGWSRSATIAAIVLVWPPCPSRFFRRRERRSRFSFSRRSRSISAFRPIWSSGSAPSSRLRRTRADASMAPIWRRSSPPEQSARPPAPGPMRAAAGRSPPRRPRAAAGALGALSFQRRHEGENEKRLVSRASPDAELTPPSC